MWVHLQGFFVGLDPALKIQGIDPALAFQKIRLLFLVQLALRGGETAAQSQATDQRPRAATQAHPKRHEPRLTEGFSKNQFFWARHTQSASPLGQHHKQLRGCRQAQSLAVGGAVPADGLAWGASPCGFTAATNGFSFSTSTAGCRGNVSGLANK